MYILILCIYVLSILILSNIIYVYIYIMYIETIPKKLKLLEMNIDYQPKFAH